jgi:hypothetical protein
MEANNQSSDDIDYRPLMISFVVVFIVWAISFAIILFAMNNWNDRGNLGDSFGGINALFSGFAFAGIIYTILLQKKELTQQRQELVDTRIELKRSADAQERSERAFKKQIEMMNLSARLNALNSAVEYYNSKATARLAKGNKVGASVYDSKANELLKEIDEILEQLRCFDFSTATAEDPALKNNTVTAV